MHSFEVNIRICQPENSDVRVLTLYVLYFYIKYFHIYKFTQVRCSLCTENKILSTIAFQIPVNQMRCSKELRFLNYCSQKINKFFKQNI